MHQEVEPGGDPVRAGDAVASFADPHRVPCRQVVRTAPGEVFA